MFSNTKKRGKRAQITIFIILAIVIISAVIAIFALRSTPKTHVSPVDNPEAYIQQCVLGLLEEKIQPLELQGGYVSPTDSVKYNEENINYLCYTADNDAICTPSIPLLKTHLEEQILKEIRPGVESCFANLKKSFESAENYQEETTDLQIEIRPSEVLARINKKITITKNSQTNSIENFNTILSDPTFDFIMIVNQIINKEVSCDCGREACHADVVQIARDNKAYEIGLFVGGYGEKVYTLEEVNTGKQFLFGVRNCVRLP